MTSHKIKRNKFGYKLLHYHRAKTKRMTHRVTSLDFTYMWIFGDIWILASLLLLGVSPMGPLLLPSTSLVARTFGSLMCLLETFYPILFRIIVFFPFHVSFPTLCRGPRGCGSWIWLLWMKMTMLASWRDFVSFRNGVNLPFCLSRGAGMLGNLILNAYLLILVRNVMNVKMLSVMFLII